MKSILFAVALWLSPSLAMATSVQFQTSEGEITVELYNTITPATVANFLAYIENESYNSSFFHRLAPDFVLQGGGFTVDENAAFTPISLRPPVINEPKLSNVRGTIAMAKLGGDPNSATSQWFFNLNNNAGNLDNQNGGFTVFGEVTQGMEVIDAIAAITTFDRLSAYPQAPLKDWQAGDAIAEHVVTLERIVVLNADPDSADALNPTPTSKNTRTNQSTSGGGSFGLWTVFLLLVGWVLARLATANTTDQKRQKSLH